MASNQKESTLYTSDFSHVMLTEFSVGSHVPILLLCFPVTELLLPYLLNKHLERVFPVVWLHVGWTLSKI